MQNDEKEQNDSPPLPQSEWRNSYDSSLTVGQRLQALETQAQRIDQLCQAIENLGRAVDSLVGANFQILEYLVDSLGVPDGDVGEVKPGQTLDG